MKIRIEVLKKRGMDKIALAALKSADTYQITKTRQGTTYSAEYDTVRGELIIVTALCDSLGTARYFIDGKACSSKDICDLISLHRPKGEKGRMMRIAADINMDKGITSFSWERVKTGDELLQEIKGQIKGSGKQQ